MPGRKYGSKRARKRARWAAIGYLLDPEDILLPTARAAHWAEWNAWEEDLGDERPWPTLSRADSANDH